MRKHYIPIIFFAGLFFLSACTNRAVTQEEEITDTQSETQVFPFGVVETFNSSVLKEPRTLNVYLPEGYDPAGKIAYPVIYVLDGSANEDFPHIAGLAQFMNMYELLPKSIVVGVANVDRKRDFTYPTNNKEDQESIPTQGGSAKFIQCLKSEVQPFIRTNYAASDHETLIGQSLGGLLATEILFKNPDLFDDYIIVSPSLWWDDEAMIKNVNEYLRAGFNGEKRIVLSRGDEHPIMNAVADQLAEAIEQRADKRVTFKYITLLEEDHATILHNEVYKAFEALYPKEREHN